jgi:ABC-type antimicrobial peptide transport system permease subunit
LNEEAVKYMGLKDPVGETVKAFGTTYQVVGVVKNMLMESPYEPIRPMIFYIDTYDRNSIINIKIRPGTSSGMAIKTTEKIYNKYNSANPFEYQFADTAYDLRFKEEVRIGKLAGFFAILAIFISCLGLFGMASFMAEQRTKEIGVRKVLGATVFNLWRLLSKDFVILVSISLIIAAPVAWYLMNNWIQDYSYRTEISWWIFAVTGIGALLIALLTVSFQSIKAAIVNPVRSLRSE